MNKNFLRNTFTSLAAVGGIGALAAGYFFAVRPWHLRWGATDKELIETLPGDEVKPDAGIQVTHAITINAPAAAVWKWLVQIGQDRGGFYSYDWLENVFGLQIHNTDEIKPEWQELKVGDFVRSAHKGWLGGRFDDTAGWFVVTFEPNRALVLRDEIEKGSWAFVLKQIGENQTRLIVRIRGDEATSFGRKILNLSVFEPAHFIMERKMLLTLKQRAEEFAVGETKKRKKELLAQTVSS
jgi:hypothetical protein